MGSTRNLLIYKEMHPVSDVLNRPMWSRNSHIFHTRNSPSWQSLTPAPDAGSRSHILAISVRCLLVADAQLASSRAQTPSATASTSRIDWRMTLVRGHTQTQVAANVQDDLVLHTKCCRAAAARRLDAPRTLSAKPQLLMADPRPLFGGR